MTKPSVKEVELNSWRFSGQNCGIHSKDRTGEEDLGGGEEGEEKEEGEGGGEKEKEGGGGRKDPCYFEVPSSPSLLSSSSTSPFSFLYTTQHDQ